MSVDVAVDGGQSRLRLAVVTDARIGPPVTVAGFHYRSGGDPTRDTARAVMEALALSGCSQPIRRICLGLTSIPGSPYRRQTFADDLLRALQADQVWAAADMVTAHAGALGGAPGVVIAAGTGAVCLGLRDKQLVRGDGLGYLLGDDGSGFAVGQAAIREALRALEGRGPATRLAAAVEQHFGHLEDFPHSIYSLEHPVAEIAAFSRVATQLAADGDSVALGICSEAVDRLVATTLSVIRRCAPDSARDPVAVSCTGGLFDARAQVFEPFAAKLTRLWPAVQLRPARGTSLDGAAHLVRSGLGPYRSLFAEAVRCTT